MDALNQATEPDYGSWDVVPDTPMSLKDEIKRWCPTHRRWEINPEGRLRCGAAWRDQYNMEREVEAEMMHPNAAILKLAESIATLAEEIQYGERVIAEPPTKPQTPPPGSPPPPPKPSPRSNGRGGVALP